MDGSGVGGTPEGEEIQENVNVEYADNNSAAEQEGQLIEIEIEVEEEEEKKHESDLKQIKAEHDIVPEEQPTVVMPAKEPETSISQKDHGVVNGLHKMALSVTAGV